eukprot:CAMPEP_0114512152 /NCGR_PEP_ID=MMETSP0109-20121206/14810_1 /TAXON_ID=29199 /ORGANISM="Chlorarachnion reptans, Strain CCCM449" /LENGTH=277 /DNA_ID=CAMNT_0001691791 /DNA_START=122 /DNA_END=955 /DNA_ORIENTATION=-
MATDLDEFIKKFQRKVEEAEEALKGYEAGDSSTQDNGEALNDKGWTDRVNVNDDARPRARSTPLPTTGNNTAEEEKNSQEQNYFNVSEEEKNSWEKTLAVHNEIFNKRIKELIAKKVEDEFKGVSYRDLAGDSETKENNDSKNNNARNNDSKKNNDTKKNNDSKKNNESEVVEGFEGFDDMDMDFGNGDPESEAPGDRKPEETADGCEGYNDNSMLFGNGDPESEAPGDRKPEGFEGFDNMDMDWGNGDLDDSETPIDAKHTDNGENELIDISGMDD